MSILVSFITLSHNSFDFYDSFYNQILPHINNDKIEFVIIDDGSNEDAKNRLNKFRSLKNVSVVFKQHQGIFLSRLQGIKSATGKYLCFIDIDDFSNITGILDLVEQNPSYSVIQFAYKKINKDENVAFTSRKDLVSFDCKDAQIIETSYPYIWGIVFEKCLWDEKIDWNNCENVNLGEDALINSIILLKTKNKLVVSDVMYFYVQHNKSITHKISSTESIKVNQYHLALTYLVKNSASDILFNYLLENYLHTLVNHIHSTCCLNIKLKEKKKILNNLCFKSDIKLYLLPFSKKKQFKTRFLINLLKNRFFLLIIFLYKFSL